MTLIGLFLLFLYVRHFKLGSSTIFLNSLHFFTLFPFVFICWEFNMLPLQLNFFICNCWLFTLLIILEGDFITFYLSHVSNYHQITVYHLDFYFPNSLVIFKATFSFFLFFSKTNCQDLLAYQCFLHILGLWAVTHFIIGIYVLQFFLC